MNNLRPNSQWGLPHTYARPVFLVEYVFMIQVEDGAWTLGGFSVPMSYN